MLKGMPKPKGSPPSVPKGSIQDALEALEGRRKRKPVKGAKGKRGDLDLASIP